MIALPLLLHFTAKTATKTTHLFQNSSYQVFSTVISRHQQEYPKHLIFSFLKNPPTHHRPTQQLHSLLLSTGLFKHSLQLFNTLLRCYSLNDYPHQSILLYKQLHDICFLSSSLLPSFDSFTYTFLVNATTNSCSTFMGFQLHGLISKMGFRNHVYVETALVNMYLSCGVLGDALVLFDEMPERNAVTWNVMITGLVKWGELQFARCLFDEMPDKNVVSWTGIIDGYVRMSRYVEGLALFRRMISFEGIEPSEITILAILPAISNTGELKACRMIHGYGEKKGFYAFDIRVANSIVDTYAKCGCIVSASRFFKEIPMDKKNLVSWTSIISGFAMYGLGKEAVEHFQRMEKEQIKPNRVTFLSVLNACSHGGLVEEGLAFFDKMVNEYQILPDIKHYGCLVDMLGRTGKLEEAEKMALGIPREISNAVVWRTLLGACSFHGNIEMGERVTRKIMEMERGHGGDYVLMHNIFAGVGRFEDAERLRRLMDDRNAVKVVGCSLV